MSAYMYDEAIINNLRSIVGDDRITITPVDTIFDIIPRLNNDKITLPLLTVTRRNWSIQSDNVNHAAKYEGALSGIYQDEGKTTIQRVQFVPMTLTYSLDVWTKQRLENDEIVRELFWYYMTSPTLQITVPYKLDFDHNFNLFIEPEIEDNSDISQHLNTGEVFRQTLTIYTDDAKLWKSSSRDPTIIDIRFKLHKQTLSEAAIDNRPTSFQP